MMTLRKKIFTPVIVFLMFAVSLSVHAGDPAPPPVGTLDGGATPIGGAAPIGEGYILLVAIVLLYAIYKYHMITKKSIIKN